MGRAPLTLARAVGIENYVALAAVADDHGRLEDLSTADRGRVEVVRADELWGDAGGVPMVDQDVCLIGAFGFHHITDCAKRVSPPAAAALNVAIAAS